MCHPKVPGSSPTSNRSAWRRWWIISFEVLAVVYGPFIVAAVNTRLFDGANTWLRVDYWKYLFVLPGGVIIELTSAAIWHRHPNISPTFLFVFSGLLSVIVVVATTWLAAKARWMRWVLLPLVCGLCTVGALALDAAMRM